MRALIISILVLLCNTLYTQVYEAPLLHCLQVDAADDVTLNWQAVANSSGSFQYYHLKRIEMFFVTDLGDRKSVV